MEEKKHCKGCNVTRDINDFYPDKHNPKGRASKCKYCHREYHKRFAIVKPFNKKWNKTNKNYYPDSEWVWEQLEQNLGVEKFYDKLNEKYKINDPKPYGKRNSKTMP